MNLLVKALEKKITKLLPNKFPIIFDGWSLDGSSTHYVAVYAKFFNSLNGIGKRRREREKKVDLEFEMSYILEVVKVLLAFTPLLEEEEYSSQNHMDSLEFVLEIYEKDFSNIICLICDNCNVNKSLANLCELPLVGCAAHRFNLAVQAYLGTPEYDAILTIVCNLIFLIILEIFYFIFLVAFHLPR